MKVMFYDRRHDYNTWIDKVTKIVNSEKAWILIKRFEAGNECETTWPKRRFQLMEIRD